MNQTANLRTFSRYASLNILGMIGISCYILADTFLYRLAQAQPALPP